jgi:hypothetical protein
MFLMKVTTLESLDGFFSWPSRQAAEALSFSLMMDAASYDDMDVLVFCVVCWFWVLEDMAEGVVVVERCGMVAMLAVVIFWIGSFVVGDV